MSWCVRSKQYTICIYLIIVMGIVSMDCSNLPCHFYDSINITDGVRQQQNIQFDGIEFPPKQYAIVDYTEDDGMRNFTKPHLRGCLCNIKPCYRLCCSNEPNITTDDAIKSLEHKCNEELNQLENEVYDESSKFINLLLGFNVTYFNNKMCMPFFVEEDYLNVARRKQLNLENRTLNSRGYCQTRIDQDTQIHLDVSICITSDELIIPNNTNLYATLDRIEHIAMIISMPFLIITLLVYAYLPMLHKNLYGKCFVCYLISQGLCFVAEILNYYDLVDLDAVVVYLFLCSFQWLNVTAFDAWWNLRSFKVVNKSTKSSDRRRFILYTLYALLSPFVLNVFKLGSDILKSAKVHTEQTEDLIRAAFIGVTFTFNIVFFILTTLKIREVQNEMNQLTSQEDSSRHQKKMNIAKGNFKLYLRLFIVMGLTYSISGLSYLILRSSTFFEWSEIFLSLQGVWIFILFVLKRRIFRLIEERCVLVMKTANLKPKPSSKTDMASTYI